MEPSLTLTPIGFIRSQQQVKFQARHQPLELEPEQHILELLPESGYEQALQDLAGFSRIWLVWWFHRNKTWRPLVLPPRGPAQRRGVFATRSPHRPNPIGLTPVQLIGVTGRKLILGACDLVDGTPVFDIKPYIPAFDIFPEAVGGWVEEVENSLSAPPKFAVCLSVLAQTQAEWLRTQWNIDFTQRLIEILARDPSPHRTRRIRRRGDVQRVIGCGAWRALFVVEGETVTVLALEAAYPRRFLNDPKLEDIPDCEAQLAFLSRWPSAWDPA
ncbi:MAG: tsaA [Verrucomicrobiales bacterium]|nr:tsaA [Verrucomicrobiales bacterium]